ncbi:MAG: PIG-L family deacetylase, partial [Anaerolineae bacterium]|nr:PIG-L family deacetylase [Anaerolineae bacterium]
MSRHPPRPLRHVFLSPHLDDAVLSCGGQMACLAAQGTPVH